MGDGVKEKSTRLVDNGPFFVAPKVFFLAWLRAQDVMVNLMTLALRSGEQSL